MMPTVAAGVQQAGRQEAWWHRGTVGKQAVVDMKGRDGIVRSCRSSTDKATRHGVISEPVDREATIYTDEHGSYGDLPHGTVCHGASPLRVWSLAGSVRPCQPQICPAPHLDGWQPGDFTIYETCLWEHHLPGSPCNSSRAEMM